MTAARVVRIANSSVMGQSAVMVTSSAAALAALAQLAGVYSSTTVSDWGGQYLDWAWSGTFLLAFVLMVAVYQLRDPLDAAWFEIGAIILMNVGILVYMKALWAVQGGYDGRLFVVCMLGAQVTNLTGRAVLLISRMGWVRKANRRADP